MKFTSSFIAETKRFWQLSDWNLIWVAHLGFRSKLQAPLLKHLHVWEGGGRLRQQNIGAHPFNLSPKAGRARGRCEIF